MALQDVMPNVPYSSTTGSGGGGAVVDGDGGTVTDGDGSGLRTRPRSAVRERPAAEHPPAAATARQRMKSGSRRMGRHRTTTRALVDLTRRVGRPVLQGGAVGGAEVRSSQGSCGTHHTAPFRH